MSFSACVYYDDNPSLIVIALDHLYRIAYLLFDRDLDVLISMRREHRRHDQFLLVTAIA